jgi:hypothetical protein
MSSKGFSTHEELHDKLMQDPEFVKVYNRIKAGGPCVDCGVHTQFWCEDCNEPCCMLCQTAVYTEQETKPEDDFLDGFFCKKCTAEYDDTHVKEPMIDESQHDFWRGK